MNLSVPLVDEPTDPNPDIGEECANGWQSYNGACYLFGQEAKLWSDAQAFCQKYPGKIFHLCY